MKLKVFVAVVSLLAGIVTGSLANLDRESVLGDVQGKVDETLALFGGQQTAWNEVSWDGGRVVLTIQPGDGVGAFSVGTCATGKFCAYSGPNGTGSKLAFSGCTADNYVSPLGQPVRSVVNAQSGSTIYGYDLNTWVLTVNYGSTVNHWSGLTTLDCY